MYWKACGSCPLRPQSLRVEAGDVRCEGEFLFGAVTNTLSVGGVVKLDPETVRLDDGLLELTLVRMPKTRWSWAKRCACSTSANTTGTWSSSSR